MKTKEQKLRDVFERHGIGADARLIDAAPDLLEALKAVVAFLEERPAGLHYGIQPEYQQAKEAIAKAEEGR